MSSIIVGKCKVKHRSSVIAGLKAIGIPSGAIQEHDTAVAIKDWHGNKTKNKANIIVDRDVCIETLGFSRSWGTDLGFATTEEGHTTLMSDMDRGNWQKNYQQTFQQQASVNDITEEARVDGLMVTSVTQDSDGVIELQLEDF